MSSKETKKEELFEHVASNDFLKFAFNGASYEASLQRAIHRTGRLCAISVTERTLSDGRKVIWMAHDFKFLGGSLGTAEGEKLVLGFERGLQKRIPVVVECRSGGARMQEGTQSLMQMAKISVAVRALRSVQPAVPFISVLQDPTYGGVSASYAMQSDVRIGVKDARIGFAGPSVILDTMYEKNQDAYDREAPRNFQRADFLQDRGQLDAVVEASEVESAVMRVLAVLCKDDEKKESTTPDDDKKRNNNNNTKYERKGDYTVSRALTRPQPQDILKGIFRDDWFELRGDGRISDDRCIRGGLATLKSDPTFRCVVIANFKGHNPKEMGEANYGMGTPHGYRKAKRLMELAERHGIPVVTLVDTCGAKPDFACERDGQSEAIATNLTLMAGLRVPIVTIVCGEGGSGGALGIAMGDVVGMMSSAYYGVISPEGAASILGRYKDEKHKAEQYPKDCRTLAKAQSVHADQLKDLGVVDTILREFEGETYEKCPKLLEEVSDFVVKSLRRLVKMSPAELVKSRYSKFRSMGNRCFKSLEDEKSRAIRVEEARRFVEEGGGKKSRRRVKNEESSSSLLRFVCDRTLSNERAHFRDLAPCAAEAYVERPCIYTASSSKTTNNSTRNTDTAKAALDRGGPDELVSWVRKNAKTRLLVTDTTYRDAHQSLLATRVRTFDMIEGAELHRRLLSDKLFSMEVWGGATFDVSYRFLFEDPWERLRRIRAALPDVCLQMLFRGSNAVGYRNYPDNLIVKFVHLAAKNGIDIFRIFDCFNSIEQMRVAIKTVRSVNKVAEVCICFSGDFCSKDEKIYTLKYYKETAKAAADAGAHMLAIKDMAGLLKPCHAEPLIRAIREVSDLPIHFHTHCTSSASLASALAMANAGCEIVDTAISSMADCTSQPSMNALLASLEGGPRDPKIDHLTLSPIVKYWANVRELYEPFESGMRCGNAKVFEHQIPGGQYSNLMVQCKAMGLWDRWDEVVDMYRDVNRLFGDIIKVTPSSKVVGDMSLYLINVGLTTKDVMSGRAEDISWPDSVVNLCRGLLGTPHHGLPPKIVKMVLSSAGAERIKERPGGALPPCDFDATKKRLETQDWPFIHRKVTEEDVVSSLLYEAVFADYLEHIRKFGEVTWLPSSVYWYGMCPGQSATFPVPERVQTDIQGASSPSSGGVVQLIMARVGPILNGDVRKVVFDVNADVGLYVDVKDTWDDDETKGAGANLRKANPDNECEIGSPLVGKVEDVVKVGTVAKQGSRIAVVCAMKMEVVVKAPFDLKIKEVCAEVGTNVEEGSLVLVVDRA